MNHEIFVIGAEEAGRTLRAHLKHRHAVPESLLRKLLRKKAIRVNGERLTPQDVLRAGDQLSLPRLSATKGDQRVQKQQICDPGLLALLRENVLYEGENELVLNKPAGLAVQGGTRVRQALDWYLAGRLLPEVTLKIVHRLDQDTAGVLLLAKNHRAAKHYTQAFKDAQIDKHYRAIVHGCPQQPQGVIQNYVRKGAGENFRERMVIVDREDSGGAYAETHYKVAQRDARGDFTLLALQIKTGRKHQIRLHCAESLGTPIVGDRKYSNKVTRAHAKALGKRAGLALQAERICFVDLNHRRHQVSIPAEKLLKL